MAVQPPSKTPGGPVGRRLIPHAIDDIARDQPERVWAMIPAKSGKGWQDITFAMLANGANQMAWFMKEKLDLPFDDSFPTVCYIGKPDFRYHMIEVAAMKTKCKVGAIDFTRLHGLTGARCYSRLTSMRCLLT